MSNLETTGLLLSKSNSIGLQQGSNALLQSIRKALTGLWNNLLYRAERSDGQRVSKLSDHLLDDIGITRQEAKEIDRRSK